MSCVSLKRYLHLHMALLFLLALMARNALAANDVAGTMLAFNQNGGWSWFQDPRVIVDNNQLIVGSVAGVAANGAIGGDIRVTSYNLTSKSVSTSTLHSALEQDDHDVPALVVLPDDRYMAIYQKHGTDNLVRWRISTNPGSTAAWGTEQTGNANPANDGNGNTYANPFYLSIDNTLYNFSRSVGYDPNYSYFTGLNATNDASLTYHYGGHFMYWVNQNNGVNGATGGPGRPYVKYASNGVDKIWFVNTEDHPQNYFNSLYAGYISFDTSGAGTVHRSDGSLVPGTNGQLSTAQTPFPAPANNSAAGIVSGTGYSYSPAAFTKVFSGSGNSVASWASSVTLDANGNPALVFSVRKNNPSDAFVANSLDYYYAHWDGQAWQTHRMGYAGSPLYNSQNDYAGLAAIDPGDPNTVFISTNYTPDTDLPLPHWEIYQGYTADDGSTWNWSAITSNSTVDNIRPLVNSIDDSRRSLVWMRGTYTSYTSYNTSIVGLIMNTTTLPGDYDHNGIVEAADYTVWQQHFGSSVGVGLGADGNGNGIIDAADYTVWRDHLAAGSADGAASTVAEPATSIPPAVGGWVLASGLLGGCRSRRPAFLL
jgi:BNR repeat-containing family member